MRLVTYNDGAVGVLDGLSVIDISQAVDDRWRGTPYAMTNVIERWEIVAALVDELVTTGPRVERGDVRLGPPVPRPRQLLAAPLNYRAHVDEMAESRHRPDGLRESDSPAKLGFFVLAAGSVAGPEDPIELPALPGRAFHHEIELAVVIGKETRRARADEVRSHIFGFMPLLDITLRTVGENQEERAMRKSFDTFTPIGPALVTADEVDLAAGLDLRLWVNGELRQRANTRDLIVGVDELIAQASHVVTLYPGDIYATGTPAGVGPIVAGDTIRATVEGVGELVKRVTQRR